MEWAMATPQYGFTSKRKIDENDRQRIAEEEKRVQERQIAAVFAVTMKAAVEDRWQANHTAFFERVDPIVESILRAFSEALELPDIVIGRSEHVDSWGIEYRWVA